MNEDTEEVWRIIVLEPKYEISSLGRVRRISPYRSTRVGKILRPSTHRDGHLQVRLCGTLYYLNRLVALTFHGDPPTPFHQAAHNDGIHANNFASNIRWATPKENFEDRLYHGSHVFGEQNPNVKLTDEQVRLIRARFRIGGERKADLARLFGVSDVQIHTIITGKQRYSAGGYL